MHAHMREARIVVWIDCKKKLWLKINHLWRKCIFPIKKYAKYLVSSQKSSTFAADFAINASERLNMAKGAKKNGMLKISHLWRKCKNIEKKLLKNLVSPKKSSTFADDFATNENSSEKQWSLKVWLINDVVQESRNAQLGNWKNV